MIRAATRAGQLVTRLTARARQIAARRAGAIRREQRRADWHSASALWPDLFGDYRDGK